MKAFESSNPITHKQVESGVCCDYCCCWQIEQLCFAEADRNLNDSATFTMQPSGAIGLAEDLQGARHTVFQLC